MYYFHGGCLECTMQDKEGLAYCTGCRYFDSNWDLPDLSNISFEMKDNEEDIVKEIAKLARKLNKKVLLK